MVTNFLTLVSYSIVSCIVQAADFHTLWVANSLLNREFLEDPSAAFKILYLLDYDINAENLVTVLTLINQARSLDIKRRNPNYPYPAPQYSNQVSNYKQSSQIGNTVLGKSNGQNFQKYPRKQVIYSQPQTTTNSVLVQEMDFTSSQVYSVFLKIFGLTTGVSVADFFSLF